MTDKMKNFVKGVLAGLVEKPLLQGEPVAYQYGNNKIPLLPKLPKWDKKKYPYVLVTVSYTIVCAYASSTPIIANGDNNISSPHLQSLAEACNIDNAYEKYAWDKWEDWQTVNGNKVNIAGVDYSWANHDIFKTDGTLYVPKEDTPAPVYLPLVICDKEVETIDTEYGNPYTHPILSFGIRVGDTLKVTVDGVSGEYTATLIAGNRCPMIGNLWFVDDQFPDDGGDWCMEYLGNLAFAREAEFITRTAGTYRLKIELIARAKE